MQATRTTPIVVAACNDDMVELGIIKSLAHPGGNLTGLNKMTLELSAKRLDLLKELGRVPTKSGPSVRFSPKATALPGGSEMTRCANRRHRRARDEFQHCVDESRVARTSNAAAISYQIALSRPNPAAAASPEIRSLDQYRFWRRDLRDNLQKMP